MEAFILEQSSPHVGKIKSPPRFNGGGLSYISDLKDYLVTVRRCVAVPASVLIITLYTPGA
jgi:hypothetical protein